MNKIRIWLSHPWIPAIAALLAVGLTLPSLWNNLNFDDYFQRLALQEDTRVIPRSSSPLNLFCFDSGNPEENWRLINKGVRPWWANDESKMCFFRPISSITHWIDYLLWPDTPALMFAQSLVWFGLLVYLVALFYRFIIGATWAAGLAALLFAIDDTHSVIGSLCNRNELITGVFAVLCLITYVRWRRDSWRSGAIFSSLCFALALLSAEMGIATLAFLLSYELYLEHGPLRNRLKYLIPFGAIFFFWLLSYILLGYGVKYAVNYTNPLNEPFLYLKALFLRAPVYLLSQWALPPLSFHSFMPSFMQKAGLVFILFLVLILTPLVRRDKIAQFWTVGILLSLLPICAVVPHRNLLFVGLGSMALLSQWFFWIEQKDWNVKSGLWRLSVRFLLIIFILIHTILAPVSLIFAVRMPAVLQDLIVRVNESLPPDSELKDKRFVLINPPGYHYFSVACLTYYRSVNEQFTPIFSLTSGGKSLILKRIDLHTIEIQAKMGSLVGLENPVFIRSKQFHLQIGQKVELDDVSIEVLDTYNNLPSVASFQFSVVLEDESLAWFHWKEGTYAPLNLPPIGETIILEEARITMG